VVKRDKSGGASWRKRSVLIYCDYWQGYGFNEAFDAMRSRIGDPIPLIVNTATSDMTEAQLNDS